MPRARLIGNILYFGMRLLVALAVLLFLVRSDWVDAVSAACILALMLVPMVLRKTDVCYLPFELEVAITSFVFITLFLGSLNDFYERFPGWDTLLHFQYGILLGFIGFVLMYLLNTGMPKRLTLSPFFAALFAASFSMAMSVVWEIYEFAADSWLGFNMQRTGLPDTMKDLIMNTLGALAVAVAAYVWMRIRLRVPFTPKRLAGTRYDRSVARGEGRG